MNLSDNTKRIIFTAVAVIVVLSIILPLIVTRFEEQRVAVSIKTIKASRMAQGGIAFVSLLLMIPLVILLFYEGWLHFRIDTVKLVHRVKIVISMIFWLIFILLTLQIAKFLIVVYCGSHRIVYHSIVSTIFCLCFGFLLWIYWKMLKYLHTQPVNKIIVGCLLHQHHNFVKKMKLDKAFSALIKTCEIAPDEVCLWCKLALFCERTRKNSVEADKYMAKAEELVTTTKANSIGDKACYFDYLGMLSYVRGERDKGLEYIKQAIGIESKPYRIKMYEELLADSKKMQSGESSQT